MAVGALRRKLELVELVARDAVERAIDVVACARAYGLQPGGAVGRKRRARTLVGAAQRLSAGALLGGARGRRVERRLLAQTKAVESRLLRAKARQHGPRNVVDIRVAVGEKRVDAARTAVVGGSLERGICVS